MPHWNDPPTQLLDSALQNAWEGLAEEVESDPSVDEVIGLPSEELTKHAVEAIAMITKSENLEIADPTILVQIYCMGFVIGTKYGEKRHRREES